MSVNSPFEDRVLLARQMIARGVSPGLPQHTLDQLAAAARDAERTAGRAAWLMPLLEPKRGWRRATMQPDVGRSALLLAALLGCSTCSRLRKEGPQPAYAHLPLRGGRHGSDAGRGSPGRPGSRGRRQVGPTSPCRPTVRVLGRHEAALDLVHDSVDKLGRGIADFRDTVDPAARRTG